MRFLPPGRFRVIYTERNIDEVLDSMEKMAGLEDPNRPETRATFIKLNDMVKALLSQRTDIEVLFVNYNEIVKEPAAVVRRIAGFLGALELDEKAMAAAVDEKLYRKRRLQP